MGAIKNWAEVATRYLLGLFGDGYRISGIPGSLSSQKTSAFQPPYKGSEIDPKQVNQKTQEIMENYHRGFFTSGLGTIQEQARKEAIRELNRPKSYEERAKQGTRLRQ